MAFLCKTVKRDRWNDELQLHENKGASDACDLCSQSMKDTAWAPQANQPACLLAFLSNKARLPQHADRRHLTKTREQGSP